MVILSNQPPQERMGLGIEIVLEVDDIDAAHRQVVEQDWPLSAPLQSRPWGATDFRVIDPDGCYPHHVREGLRAAWMHRALEMVEADE